MSTDKSRGKKSDMTSEELRGEIIQAARKQFAVHGFQGLNLKDVAAEVGIANSLINYHFTDKEGLLQAVMEPFARGRMEAILRILGEPKSRDEVKVRIQLFAEEMLAAISQDPYSLEIIDREVKAGNPVILKIFESTMLLAFRGVVEFFQQAKRNGILREEFDPLICSALLFTSCCDVVRKDVLAKKFFGVTFADPGWRKRFAQHVVDLFMNGALK
jgi:AcrR family transcriptional regulator